MNKAQFITYMSQQNNCTKAEAEKVLDMFIPCLSDSFAVDLVYLEFLALL